MLKNNFRIKFIFFLSLFSILCLPSFVAAADVVINEIMTGQTDATKNEFIELYNSTENSIDLTGYKLKKKTKSGAESNLVSSSNFIGIIPSHGYFLIAHPDYKDTINADLAYSGSSYSIASNNTIILYDKEDNLIDKVGYGDEVIDFENQATANPENDQSIERQPVGYDSDNNSADFVIQNTPNPQNSSGQQTIPEYNGEPATDEATGGGTTTSTPVNQPPLAQAGADITALVGQEIIFDGSLSSDPDNDTLNYFWNFGDGATDTEQTAKHTYLYPGQYIVSLQVSDGEFSDLDIITVNIYIQSIIISEFLPDPEGDDQEGEWIELFNQSSQIANLTNWQIDDQDGGSSPFVFPANSLIAPEQFLVLMRPITKIALNNDNDQVRLIYPDGSLAAEVNYLAEKKRGFSVAFDGSDYFWTKIITPGSANIISSADLDIKEENPSSNNPQPIIQETQSLPDVAINTNLNQSQSFDASNPLTESGTCLLDSCLAEGNTEPEQTDDVIGNYNNTDLTASLNQSAQSNQKSKLILYLSIIISGSLLLSWVVIQIKKYGQARP